MLPPAIPIAPSPDTGSSMTGLPTNTPNAEHGEEFAKVLDHVAHDAAEETSTDAAQAGTADPATPADVDSAATTADTPAPINIVIPAPVVATDIAAAAVEVAVANASQAFPAQNIVQTSLSESDITNIAIGAIAETTPEGEMPGVNMTPASNNPIDVQLDDPSATSGNTTNVDPKLTTLPDPAAESGNGLTAPPADLDAPDATQLVEDFTESVAAAVAKTTSAEADGAKTGSVASSIGDSAPKSVLDMLAQTPKTESVTQATPAAKAPANIPLEPYRQVMNVVQPLRQLPDGDYRMILQLHPEQLGRVEVAVAMSNGQISMQLSSDNPAARQVLRDSMNDLRVSLIDAGIETGSLDVGTRDPSERQQDTSNSNSSNIVYGDEIADEEFFARLAATAAQPATDGPLDVRL